MVFYLGRNKRHRLLFLQVFFDWGLNFGGDFAGDVSGAVIGLTSVLVDGFREETETGRAPVLVSSLRLPLAAPSLVRV